jgi:hypothetical protein
LTQKQPDAKQYLSVATEDLEKDCIVFLTTTVATNSYIRCNGINHLRTKIIQNLLEDYPFIIVVTDLKFVTTDAIERISNCSQYTTVVTDLTSVAMDNLV